MIGATFVNADGSVEYGSVREGPDGRPPKHWSRHARWPSMPPPDLLVQQAIPPSSSVQVRRYRLDEGWDWGWEVEYVETPFGVMSHRGQAEENPKEG